MRVYLDSSVLLRVVLGEPGRLPEWPKITHATSSELARVECLRGLDRLRLDGEMPDREIGRRRATLVKLLEGMELARINRTVLDRAAEPFATRVRTLDALHLATALLVVARDARTRFATHDDELAVAAEAMGLHVIGV